MKNLKNIVGVLFFAVAMAGSPIHAAEKAWEKIEASVNRVDKEMSLLDHIIKQANVVVDSTDQKARTQAKRNLDTLMKREDLDENIKDAIQKDISIIKNPITKRQMYAAHISLLNTYAKINTQANVVEAIAHATEMVENASSEELDEVLIEAKEMIEKAEEEQQGTVGRWYAKAKRMVTAPVDYVFGEESSYAKTAFYGVVGAALLAAGAYAASNYMGGGVVDEGVFAKIRTWSPGMKAHLQEEFGDDLEAQKEGLGAMLPALQAEKLQLIKSDERLARQITAAKEEWEDLVEKTPLRPEVRSFLYGRIPKIDASQEESELINKSSDLNKKIMSLKAQKNKNFTRQYSIDELNDYYNYLNYKYPGIAKGAEKETLAQDDEKTSLAEENVDSTKNANDQREEEYRQAADRRKEEYRQGVARIEEEYRQNMQKEYVRFFENSGNGYILQLPKEDIHSRLSLLSNDIKQLSDKKESLVSQMKELDNTYYYYPENKRAELMRLKGEWHTSNDEQKRLGNEKFFLNYALENIEKFKDSKEKIAQPEEKITSPKAIVAEPEVNIVELKETSVQPKEENVAEKENIAQSEEKITQPKAIIVEPEESSVKPEESSVQSEEKIAAEKEKSARWAKKRADMREKARKRKRR